MAKINIKIEGQSYQVEEGLTILEAAKSKERCSYAFNLIRILFDILNYPPFAYILYRLAPNELPDFLCSELTTLPGVSATSHISAKLNY